MIVFPACHLGVSLVFVGGASLANRINSTVADNQSSPRASIKTAEWNLS